MLSLPELQARFAATLFDDTAASPPAWIRAAGIAPELRLGIYRNNLEAGFANTLALEFPVIQRLVGEDYFRQLALSFLARHPSRSGDLHHIGAPFADFLRAQYAATCYRYFADVAALEWALQECLVAENDETLEPSVLQAVPPHACSNPHSPSCASGKRTSLALPRRKPSISPLDLSLRWHIGQQVVRESRACPPASLRCCRLLRLVCRSKRHSMRASRASRALTCGLRCTAAASLASSRT